MEFAFWLLLLLFGREEEEMVGGGGKKKKRTNMMVSMIVALMLMMPIPSIAAASSSSGHNPMCNGCVLVGKTDPLSVVPGPCRLDARKTTCYNYEYNTTCPQGSSPCVRANETIDFTDTSVIVPFPIISNQTHIPIQVLTGTTIVFQAPSYITNRKLCVRSQTEDVCELYSGTLVPFQSFWFPVFVEGIFYVSDTVATSYYATRYVLTVIRNVSTTVAPLTTAAYFSVRLYFHSIKCSFFVNANQSNYFRTAIWHTLISMHPSITNSTLLNITIGPCASTVVVVVFVSSIEVSNAVKAIAPVLTVPFEGISYPASLASSESNPNSPTSTDTSSKNVLEIVAPIVGGIVVMSFLLAVVNKRRRAAALQMMEETSRPHKRATFELKEQEVFNLYHAIEQGNTQYVERVLSIFMTPPHMSPSGSDHGGTSSDSAIVAISPPSTASSTASSVDIEFEVTSGNKSKQQQQQQPMLPPLCGRSPLSAAIMYNKPDIVRMLIDSGCDVNAPNSCAQTPLHVACILGCDQQIMRLLIATDTSINETDLEHATPLWYACLHNHLNHVQRLIEAGADVDKPDCRSMTPLIIAASRGNADVVAELLQLHNLQVNDKDLHGWTALHWACATDRPDIVELLLRHRRIRVPVHNNKDENPLHLAAREGCQGCADLLMGHDKAETIRLLLASTSAEGHTAASLARLRGHEDLAVALEACMATVSTDHSASDSPIHPNAVHEDITIDATDAPDHLSPTRAPSSGHTPEEEEEDTDDDQRRLRMRKYMRARRKAHKEQESTFQQQVDELATEHEILQNELIRARQEADMLRARLGGQPQQQQLQQQQQQQSADIFPITAC